MLATIQSRDYELVAQVAHAALGALGVLVPAVLAGTMEVALVFAVITLAAAGAKEFYWDMAVQPADIRGSCLRDLAFYAGGVMFGLLTAFCGNLQAVS